MGRTRLVRFRRRPLWWMDGWPREGTSLRVWSGPIKVPPPRAEGVTAGDGHDRRRRVEFFPAQGFAAGISLSRKNR